MRLLRTPLSASQRELELQLALGSALMATRGYAAPEVEQAYVRARALCSHIGHTPQLFPVLHGLYRIYHVRGDLIAAREVGEQLTELAQSLGDQTLLVEAHRALGVPLLWLGEVALARAKLEEGTALYDAKLLRSHAYTYGIDPGVVCLSYAALAWWFLGFADHALDRSQRALALAEELSHPHSRALALVWAAWLRQFRREAPQHGGTGAGSCPLMWRARLSALEADGGHLARLGADRERTETGRVHRANAAGAGRSPSDRRRALAAMFPRPDRRSM